jgi:hypothetical protein
MSIATISEIVKLETTFNFMRGYLIPGLEGKAVLQACRAIEILCEKIEKG